MRLNAWLARAGVASRRKADELIKAGRVTVNGETGRLNTFVGADDEVRLDGKPLRKQQLAYVLLHKPAGVVTTAHDPQGRETVVDLVRHASRVVPVGRLDAETTGALLLTNDGDLAHRLAHPRYEVDKVYEVETWQQPTDAQLDELRNGVEPDASRRRDSHRREPVRADDPRGPQPAGAAHGRGDRAPREAAAPEPLRAADARRARAPRVAGARALRSRGAPVYAGFAAASACARSSRL
jgi:23S rRNA pseudouridine2605 synthase